MNLVIGSSDINHLMMKKETSGFKDLLRKFLSDVKPNYNALASSIDACRTGAILEQRYADILPDGYYSQYKVTSGDMNVLTSTLDFALLSDGNVVDFDELKTLHLYDFLEVIEPLRDEFEDDYLPVIKKQFKSYYNQVQAQLFCANIQSANLVFLAVDSYDDEKNYNRIIQPNDYVKFRIFRDDKTINDIKERAMLFQTIKDYFKN